MYHLKFIFIPLTFTKTSSTDFPTHPVKGKVKRSKRENWRREALTALDRKGRTGWSPEVWRWREEVPEESLEILS